MPAARNDAQLDSAPARFLDQFEELRVELSNEQLIAEAIEINHAGIGKDKTLERYRDHLIHFSHYLASVHGATFYTARRKHVRLFMGHLEKPGGAKPHDSRLRCEWCKASDPDGRSGPGWSASYRKSYLSALKFLYRHFLAEDDLPDHNPAALESSPKIIYKRGYTPTRDDIKRLLEAGGPRRGACLPTGCSTRPRDSRRSPTRAGPTSILSKRPGKSSARAIRWTSSRSPLPCFASCGYTAAGSSPRLSRTRRSATR